MEINLNHPVIDEQEDGYYLYFHDLPPLLGNDIIAFPDEPFPYEEDD